MLYCRLNINFHYRSVALSLKIAATHCSEVPDYWLPDWWGPPVYYSCISSKMNLYALIFFITVYVYILLDYIQPKEQFSLFLYSLIFK